MAQVNTIYKCGLCGNMVEFVHDGGTIPVCCGVEMNHVAENTQENKCPIQIYAGKTDARNAAKEIRHQQ